MTFLLPDLPYSRDALQPYMSAKTLDLHHGKHHKTYVDELNKRVQGTPLANRTLEEIVIATAGSHDPDEKKIFNNAAQTWNHNLFWQSMTPAGGGHPSGDLARRIDADFGDLTAFKSRFREKALGQFGSGYAWLVADASRLAVENTANAYPPFVDGRRVLLCCDVWEHAYYVDYENRRKDFVDAFLDHLIHWDTAARRLAAS